MTTPDHMKAVAEAEAFAPDFQSEARAVHDLLRSHDWYALADTRAERLLHERLTRLVSCEEFAALLARAERAEATLREIAKAGDPVQPIQYHETPDYAELTFGEHQTQAMTMAPADWVALDAALTLARQYFTTDKGDAG